MQRKTAGQKIVNLVKSEYSVAAKPPVRKNGNHLSG